MPTDLQALLAAVVADPSDDVARLVYADCLEEHGNAARAAFIRLQIEAERHHLNSNARAALEAQAWTLFEQHWPEWWGEVCTAVGWPPLTQKPVGGWKKLAQRVGLAQAPGPLYRVSGFAIHGKPQGVIFAPDEPIATFRRGFPDSAIPHLAWSRVSPLLSATVLAGDDNRVDGPHLSTVRAVNLQGYSPSALDHILRSPHFERVESLRLERGTAFGNPTTRLADDLARALTAPRARQLKHLALNVWDERTAEVLANAENLFRLEALDVTLMHTWSRENEASGNRCLALIARSPHFARLKEISVSGGYNATGIAALIQKPVWAELRKLELDRWDWNGRNNPFAAAHGIPALDELNLLAFSLNERAVRALVAAPLIKQLRHLALWGPPVEAAYLTALADAVDAQRIETLCLMTTNVDPACRAILRAKFGDRIRFPVND